MFYVSGSFGSRLSVGATVAVASLLLAGPPRAGAVDKTAAGGTQLPDAWADALHWRCIGPANMGGRITDIAVYEKDPCIFWIATASGGLLKTRNNGVTFEHQFDHENTVSIGAVAVAQSDPNIVWVGTGEANPRNSVSWGDGVYKSVDGGKTWSHMGLNDTFQTGRIAIHPNNPDIVYVAALGRLWGPNEARGLYKTTDGGKTWDKVLYVDDKTGVVDVRINPDDPDTLLAAAYERQRDGFDSNDPAKKMGPGSGLYKTTNGGKIWMKITAGLPSCNLGRIGLDYYRKDPKIVYMVLESERIGQEPENAAFMGIRGEDADVGARLTDVTKDAPAAKAGLKKNDIVISVGDKIVHSYNDFVREIRRRLAGDKVSVEVSRNRKSVVAEVTLDKKPKPDGSGATDGSRGGRRRRRSPFGSGLGGQRENVQDQQGKEGHEYGGAYKSTDGGDTWTRINSVNPRPMYYSQIRVDPSDDKYVYVLGTSLYRSKDGGATFTSDGARGIHVDHHALWIDPKDGRHMILGNDGGMHVTYDRMDHWDTLNHVAIGQFYHVTVGPRRNYNVYGGLQDNGSWGGPSRSRYGGGPVNSDWFRVGGGDGFICRVDPEDADQIYFESQNGSMGRINLRTGNRGFIRPPRRRGGPPGQPRRRYRFNWKTPYILSTHNSRIHYSAGNYVFRSLDRGDDVRVISPDITRTSKGAATAIAESQHDPDVLYVGTTDGAMWVTRDGGHEWTKVTDFPEEKSDADGKSTTETPDAPAGAKADSTGPSAATPAPESQTKSEGALEAKPGAKPKAGRPPDADARTDAPPDPEPETVPRRGARRAVRDERGRPPGGGGLWDRLRRRDKNGNGTIERDEVPDRMSRFFERADTNGDGSIDAAEMRAVAQRRRGGRGRGRRERQPDAVKAPPAVSGEADTAASPTAEAMGHPSETASPTAEAMGHPSGEGGANAKPADAKTAGAETAGAEAVNARAAGEPAAAPGDDPISGEWTADMDIEGMGGDRPQFFMTLKLAAGGAVSGSYSSQMSDGDATSGRFDKETGRLTLVFDTGRFVLDTTATVRGDTMSGNVDVGDGMFSFDFTAKRTKSAAGEVAAAAADAPPAGADAEPAFTFKPLTELLPGPRWVSSIETSHAQAGRVYVTFDGHRSNDDEPHVFVSENNGETWRSIRANLPASAGSTRVIREDIKNPDILYLGTEFGLWVSLDRGARWSKLNGNLPTVAVHEVAIHPTAGEIVVATHGRSLWVLDVTPLREITRAVVDEAVHLFAPRSGIHWRRQPPRGGDGGRRFVGENPASGAQVYYALKDDAGDVNLEITDLSGKTIRKLDGPSERGLHRVAWNLRRDPDPRRNRRGRRGRGGRFGRRGRLVPAGTYRVALTVDGERFTRDVIVETDPDHPDYHPWEREYEDVAFELFMGAEEDADGSPDVTDPGGL